MQQSLPRPMTPLISVLLPVHDAQGTLALCLESIRRQRGARWECIAVDDGSSDGSLACLRRAAALDPRVRVLARQHSGIVASLNAGLLECQGKYVARMDADDIMLGDRLRSQVEALERDESLAGVGCHVRIFPRGEHAAGRRPYEGWLNSLRDAAQVRRDAFVECPLAHPSWMLRRSLFERYPYHARHWPEDYDLLLRLLGDGHELGVVPRRLLCWRDGKGRLSRTSPDYALERFTACKAHFLAQGPLARDARYVLWGYGKTGRALSRALAEHGKQPCAIVELHPGRVGQTIQGAKVIAPRELPCVSAPGAGPFIIASIARPAPRAEVRRALAELGFRELRDFVCAA
ncbi:MAG TPA: glycosyltransferase family 2 protein [Polyangiaceae bacterium]|nr:glycosyltransferase family 2 protein [Polyangiaceae bacterium]